MIEFRNVSMTYKTGIQALKNVSFKVQDGEFVFVIGLSGSGKSTLIKLLTCEENPSAGKVFIDDYEISFLRRSLIPYLRRNIGMVFQDFRLIYSKTVYENVAFAMEIIGASENLIKRRVPIVLSIVGLRDKASMKANQLSGGEQQRVVIARAMVNNPMLILADEPTGNLDPVNSESIMALLEEINYSGTTVMVCTHESSIVNRMHRRVIEISDGSLVRDEMSGEYNLATSHENQKQKNRNAKMKNPTDSAPTRKKLPAHGIPFVRNIDIKFSEAEKSEPIGEMERADVPFIADPEGTDAFSTADPEETNAFSIPISMAETKDADTFTRIKKEETDAVSATEAGTDTSASSLEEAKIRTAALSYYQRKVHDFQNPGLKKSKSPVEEPVDFQSLIKPKRVEEAAVTEDLE